MKFNLGILASVTIAISLIIIRPANANDGGIGQEVKQGSDLLTLSNDANAKLNESKYKIQFFETDGELYESKAKSHFQSLPRDNKLLVTVYFYKQYNGTSTKVKYYLLADQDALYSTQGRFYQTLVPSYENKSAKQAAATIMSNFVPEFDANPWTVSEKIHSGYTLLALCLIGGGGLAILKLIE